MQLLKELLALDEAKKTKVSKKSAKAVYHRDYVKTKNKVYRQYNKHEHEQEKE